MKTAMLLFSVFLSMASTAQGQNFPERPIRIIVPFAPGGGTDISARMIAGPMQAGLGQPVIVENRAGASGSIGTDAVAKATPDGYTLTMGSGGTMTINHQMAVVPYEPAKDFIPVGMVATNVLALVTTPSFPVKTVQELIAVLKAKPGGYNYSSPGTGTPHQLTMELFVAQTGTKITHIAYKGSGPSISDLVGGQVQLAFETISPVMPHIKSGKLNVIATSGLRRSPELPDVPTIAESGLPGFESFSWYGLLAPAGTPKLVVDRLNRELQKALQIEEIRQRLTSMGAAPAPGTSEQMGEHIKAETAKWGKVIKALNLKASS